VTISRRLFNGAAMVLALVSAQALAATTSDPDSGWIEASKKALTSGVSGASHEAPSAEIDPGYRAEGEALLNAAQKMTESAPIDVPGIGEVGSFSRQGEDHEQPTAKYRVFASFAMGREAIKDLYALSSRSPDVAIVFRGIPRNMKVGEWVRSMQDLIVDHDQAPSVELDPVRFADAGIELVPAIVAYDGDAIVAKAAGISNPDWLAQRLAAGESGDLGNHGPVVPPTERDLLEEIHANVMAYDWDGAKKRALERFFARQTWVELPAATEARRRAVDPSFEVTRDVVLPDGLVLANIGQRINPLDRMPFDQRVIVFDGSDPRQVRAVKALAGPIADRPTTYITTTVDRAKGMADIERLTTELGAHVTILTRQLADTLHLERVPSVVTAEGNRLIVEELAVKETANAGADQSP
jgi:conjugal transfer pilus assembly protein TraW